MKPCKMCEARGGQTWPGDAPKCSFPDDGEFNEGGWNCATANAIRDLTGQDEPHPKADYRYCDDQNYSTLHIYDVELPNDTYAYALWVTWYKHRGRTEGMWLLTCDAPPRKPTEADALAIIGALTPK